MDGIRRRKRKTSPKRTSTPRSFQDSKKNQKHLVKKVIPKNQQKQFSIVKIFKKYNRLWMFLFSVVCVLVIITIFGNSRHHSRVLLTPRIDKLELNETVIATFEDTSDFINIGRVTATNSVEREVASDTTMIQEEFATGVVRIQNTVSTDVEKLLPDTRLKSEGGLIYHLPNREIYIPAKTDSGPGVIDVEIIADQPGEEYNIMADSIFTIPGYQEFGQISKFQGITGVALSDFVGGMVSTGPGLSQSLYNEISNELKAELEQKNAERNNHTVVDTIIPVVGPRNNILNELITKEVDNEILLASLESQNSFLAISKHDLENYIANKFEYPVKIINTQGLTVTLTDNTISLTEELTSNTVTLALSGEIYTKADISVERVQRELAGSDTEKISSWAIARDDIDKVNVTTRPFWKKTLPQLHNVTVILEE